MRHFNRQSVLIGVLVFISFSQSLLSHVSPKQLFVRGNDPEIMCDPITYYGVQHCGNENDPLNLVLIDIDDPQVTFQVVLPSANPGQGDFPECNSVNTNIRDPLSNCNNPFPFEKLSSMLGRYVNLGGVALINTDYFGSEDGDHGSQGLTVRNSERLDGPNHAVGNNLAVTAPSLAISNLKSISIGFPESQAYIDKHLNDIYNNATGGGPLIVKNGTVIQNPCKGFYGGDTCSRDAQSAVGVTSDNRLILVTAKMNAEDLATILVEQYQVISAIKFDGGGSARMVWLDEAQTIKTFGATNEDRSIAAALLVLSAPIENPILIEPEQPNSFWDRIKKGWNDFWHGIGESIKSWWLAQQEKISDAWNKWWNEQKIKLSDGFDAWWQEQQRKLRDCLITTTCASQPPQT